MVALLTLHPIYLLKVLLNKLLSRKKRTAIIITGSGASTFPGAGVLTYSASKIFVSFLG
jgi:short-subunit dehydrogenase